VDIEKYSPAIVRNPSQSRKSGGAGSRRVEIERQRFGVIVALDKLFAVEVPPADQRPQLRLVWPAIEAINRDRAGEGLRAFIDRRGRDLYAIGGQLELFATVRVVMAARPERQTWNRMQLANLWGDIGANESGAA
jgi:hypothetical protein